jgi:hypothetical protein
MDGIFVLKRQLQKLFSRLPIGTLQRSAYPSRLLLATQMEVAEVMVAHGGRSAGDTVGFNLLAGANFYWVRGHSGSIRWIGELCRDYSHFDIYHGI